VRPPHRVREYRHRRIARWLLVLIAIVVFALVILASLCALGLIFPSVRISRPTVPKITAPSISLPRVSTPGVSDPNIGTPSISLPSVSAPNIGTPSISLPSVSAPNIGTPSVSLPSFSDGSEGSDGAPAESTDNDIYSIKSLNIRHWRFAFVWRLPWWILAALLLATVATAGRRVSRTASGRWAIALDVLLASVAIWLLVTAAVEVPDANLAPAFPRLVQTTRQANDNGTFTITELHIIDVYPPPIEITVDLVLLAAAATLIAGRRMRQFRTSLGNAAPSEAPA
jgi:hypothetical protein